ncbi:Mediator of RNA polymerase II transcription subunit 24 [Nesidiocoris tenuis]|uniref:Mediator of RNA polymerase II transcription subunit 9 n=1 Tax=Nesidiocoris tenuis TaxID=355587 RepID=A0ABN7AZ21_9HEMI|nr:Mediator of RNA polymerase II transcription subunit 24 [Nesidiocoris tenuis]
MIMENSNDNQEPPAAEVTSTITVDDVDVDFLPIIFDIVRGLERESTDASQKPPGGSQDISQKLIELHKKLELARDQIKRLPGVEYSQEQQIEKLEGLRKQLRLKRELLLKYRTMCSFDIPKI